MELKFFDQIKRQAAKRDSWLCVGLDIEPARIPESARKSRNAQADFGRRIIETTADIALCYKINIAFFEAEGSSGYQALNELMLAIPAEVPVILDAKRGDIGNTARQYAKACFEDMGAGAVTVNPYLGGDSLEPFLKHEDKGVIVLGLTSNPGSRDFQFLECEGKPLYEHVAVKVAEWNTRGNCGLVVGATHQGMLERIRALAPEVPFLVPGIGAQGGTLEEVVRHGLTASGVPPMINSSRGILYASDAVHFPQAAREAAIRLRDKIRAARDEV
mgnify:FL=1